MRWKFIDPIRSSAEYKLPKRSTVLIIESDAMEAVFETPKESYASITSSIFMLRNAAEQCLQATTIIPESVWYPYPIMMCYRSPFASIQIKQSLQENWLKIEYVPRGEVTEKFMYGLKILAPTEPDVYGLYFAL